MVDNGNPEVHASREGCGGDQDPEIATLRVSTPDCCVMGQRGAEGKKETSGGATRRDAGAFWSCGSEGFVVRQEGEVWWSGRRPPAFREGKKVGENDGVWGGWFPNVRLRGETLRTQLFKSIFGMPLHVPYNCVPWRRTADALVWARADIGLSPMSPDTGAPADAPSLARGRGPVSARLWPAGVCPTPMVSSLRLRSRVGGSVYSTRGAVAAPVARASGGRGRRRWGRVSARGVSPRDAVALV